ncbi:DUF411 domain-containing protein [Cupriavidus basilensis]
MLAALARCCPGAAPGRRAQARDWRQSLEIADVRLLQGLGRAFAGEQLPGHDVRGGRSARRAQQGGHARRYGSCHTAVVEGYALEGHVPAREIRRLLRNARPGRAGGAGMPLGSPGMDGPEYGGRKTPYDVLLVMRDGKAKVFQTYS